MSLRVSYTPPRVNGAIVMHAAAEHAAMQAANIFLEESQPLVPVDTGALKASGQVVKEGGPSAAIVYGQSDGAGRDGRDTADYAIFVHERMDTAHPHGRAKFLEVALHQGAERAAVAVAATLRAATR